MEHRMCHVWMDTVPRVLRQDEERSWEILMEGARDMLWGGVWGGISTFPLISSAHEPIILFVVSDAACIAVCRIVALCMDKSFVRRSDVGTRLPSRIARLCSVTVCSNLRKRHICEDSLCQGPNTTRVGEEGCLWALSERVSEKHA